MTLEFEVKFHAPVLRASGYAAEGYDASVDIERPIEAGAIKGAMRAAAEHVLRLPAAKVEPAFEPRPGRHRWHWRVLHQRPFQAPSKEQVDLSDPRTGVLHRVAIESDTHTAKPDHLLRARTAHLDSLSFEVVWLGSGDGPADDRLVLRASAAAVHALGAHRRRGLGWAGIDQELASEEIDQLLGWRAGR